MNNYQSHYIKKSFNYKEFFIHYRLIILLMGLNKLINKNIRS